MRPEWFRADGGAGRRNGRYGSPSLPPSALFFESPSTACPHASRPHSRRTGGNGFNGTAGQHLWDHVCRTTLVRRHSCHDILAARSDRSVRHRRSWHDTLCERCDARHDRTRCRPRFSPVRVSVECVGSTVTSRGSGLAWKCGMRMSFAGRTVTLEREGLPAPCEDAMDTLAAGRGAFPE